MNVFVKIKGWYFCNRFRILLLPSEVLITSQEAFKFEKLCWKNTKQNMSSLFIEAFYFLLECCWDYLRQYWGLTWPFRKAFIFSHIWDHCLSSLFAKFGNWKTAHFRNEKFCFQGKILQEVEIRSWSNGVCRSRGTSFRWHFINTSICWLFANKVQSVILPWMELRRQLYSNWLFILSKK